MTMRLTILSVLIAVIAALLIFFQCTFTVNESEFAIKVSAKGDIEKSDYRPGLQFMMPMVDNFHVFDRRIVTHNYSEERFPSSEGQVLRINFFAQWQISDVVAYYKATAGDESVVAQQLAEPIKNVLKDMIAKRTLQQAVALNHQDLFDEVSRGDSIKVSSLGITLVDVRIQKMAFPDNYTDSVFTGMQSGFRQSAAQLRAEGEAQSKEIIAQADRDHDEILANAKRDAEIIRGEGEAKAAAIYANAYGRNAEFYSFYRSMQAYRVSLGKPNDVLVISPDSEFFKYFNKSGAR